MNRNITKPLAPFAPSYAINWSGYMEGAIPADMDGLTVERVNGDTIVSVNGDKFNCHPKVTKCGIGSGFLVEYDDYIQYDNGVYPIRFKV